MLIRFIRFWELLRGTHLFLSNSSPGSGSDNYLVIVFNIRVVTSVRVMYLVQDRDCNKRQVQGLHFKFGL